MQNSDSPRGGIRSKKNVEEIGWEEFSSPGGRFRCRGRELGKATGSRRIGFNVAVIPPGASSCPLHYHMNQEEFFWVLEGSGTVREWFDGEVTETPIVKGDALSYPAGEKIAHEFRNTSADDLVLFVAGERREPEVCYYPDSDKWGASGIDTNFRLTPSDYWDGEDPTTGT